MAMKINNPTISVPSKREKEPKITRRQKQLIAHLLQLIESKSFSQATINSLGMWQADFFINKLVAFRDSVTKSHPLASQSQY